ncbi:hypothetical protein PC129_g8577 [Phytophthora cactorum]|uniref:Uncharacterized protein n=1 Tax=Phytophthora cactorum TaxID=29920 RepID=A0A329SQ96_9STRA|nr:hypothetical protein Pcac1_g24662 [Phytophthora cactorum]KAG2836120.1 hypothetical protein PC112_g5400 [Phytophthora cactorum]KAG2847600.1 hypothetical protein PC111_g719 [Phytophthora cactorum]KAG2866085.1 hypothetical protein PC113_g3147 [Phytophthora cactorum]KAG2932606.1 hypothetical protein PC114_g1794 [Phytophthora cactorum]
MIERSHELFQQEVIADTSSPYEADLATNKGKQLEAKEIIVTNLDVLNLQAPSKARGKVSTKGKWSVKEFQSNCPVATKAFHKWMNNTADLDYVGKVAAKYSVCYKKNYMMLRAPTVLLRPGSAVINDPNFTIPWKRVQHVNSTLVEFAMQRDTQNDYELVDVGPDGDVQRLTWFQKWAASPCK